MKTKPMHEAQVSAAEWMATGEELAQLAAAAQGSQPDNGTLCGMIRNFRTEYGPAFHQETFVQGWQVGVGSF